jgi:hypothetical protein
VVGIAQNTLVAFLSSGCSTCADFWESFGGSGPALPFGTRLVVVTKGVDADQHHPARGAGTPSPVGTHRSLLCRR